MFFNRRAIEFFGRKNLWNFFSLIRTQLNHQVNIMLEARNAIDDTGHRACDHIAKTKNVHGSGKYLE
jgi:hypothetical protein